MTSLLITLALTPMVKAIAKRNGLVDCPDGKRKLQAAPVPLGGGLAVFPGWVAGLVCGVWLTTGRLPGETTWLLIAAGGGLLGVGILDDVRGLRAGAKLLGQAVAIAPLACLGAWPESYALAGLVVDLGWAAPLWTLVWLVACVNAMNLVDGMDGFAATIAASIAISLCVLAAWTSAVGSVLIAGSLLGAVLGFFPYNRPSARIYLGDAGSMLLGLVLGGAALVASTPASGVARILPAVAVMSLPLWDAALAVVRRRLARISIATADRGHLHHRLLHGGLSGYSALALVAAVVAASAVAGILAVALDRDGFGLAILTLLYAGLAAWRIAGNHELAMLLARAANGAAELARRLTDEHPARNASLTEHVERLAEAFPIAAVQVTAERDGHVVLDESFPREGSGRAAAELPILTLQSETTRPDRVVPRRLNVSECPMLRSLSVAVAGNEGVNCEVSVRLDAGCGLSPAEESRLRAEINTFAQSVAAAATEAGPPATPGQPDARDVVARRAA